MFDVQWIEPGPAAAVETLVRRTEHLCRASPPGDSDYQYCHVEMLARFSVLDRNNVNLGAVNEFIRGTNKWRTEPERRHSGRRSGGRHSYDYNYTTRQQDYGPGAGQTSCGWCTFDFLNRTLNSWTEGGMLSPESKHPVSLPEFIRRVRAAGGRCAPTETWDKIYEEAIARYSSAGFLQEDWEHSLPSGDLHYLVKNGPSMGDSPVSDISAELARISSPKCREDLNASPDKISNTQVCLSELEKHYTSTKCYINLSRDMLSKMVEDEKEFRDLRNDYCRRQCSEALEYTPYSKCVPEDMTHEANQFDKDYWMARNQRDIYCNLLGQTTSARNCPQALLSIKKTSWALTGRPKSSLFIVEIEKALDERKRKFPSEETRWELDDSQRVLASSGSRADRKEGIKLERERERAAHEKEQVARNSVCAGCIWTWVIGHDMFGVMEYMEGASYASKYVDFVKKYHSTCTSLGATWLGGVPYGDDPIIWRIKNSQEQIMRLIDPSGGWNGKEVYGVNEANGRVYRYRRTKATGSYLDVWSLWDVLRAERGIKAIEEGRFEEWKLEEKEHRREADKDIWVVNPVGSVAYSGPKNGLNGEKKEL